MVVLGINGARKPYVSIGLSRLGATILVGSSHERLELGVSFIEIFLGFLRTYTVFKAIYRIELVDSTAIQLVNTFKSFLPKCLLVVGQKKPSKFLSLEKIFAVVLSFGHCKYFCPV